MSETFDCPNCSAPLDYQDTGDLLIRCPYCSSSVIVPEALRSVKASNPELQASHTGMASDNLVAQAMQFAEIASLIQDGAKIEAIKRYREITGLGLKEAREAVEALEEGRPVTLLAAQDNLQDQLTADGLSEEEILRDLEEATQMVNFGKKIEAVKHLRTKYTLSLSTAKSIADLLQAGDREKATHYLVNESRKLAPAVPSIRVDRTLLKRTAILGGTGIGCYGLVLALFILAVTVIPVFFALAQPGGPLFEFWARVNPVGKHRLVLSFGEEGTGPGLLHDPRYITLDRQGNLYVADFNSGRVQRFDTSGNYLSQWMLEGEPYVQTIAAGQDGEVYVVHSGRIFIYDGLTGTLEKEAELSSEEGIYVDDLALAADGSLAIIARGEHLYRLSPSGELNLDIPEAVSGVSGDSELSARVAVDGLGNIFLLGAFNNGVFKYSAAGNFITRFGASGDEPGQFRAVSAIGVDGQGRVYVSDIKGVQIFDNDGRYLQTIGVDGHAHGLDLDSDDNLILVTNRPRVLKFSLNRP